MADNRMTDQPLYPPPELCGLALFDTGRSCCRPFGHAGACGGIDPSSAVEGDRPRALPEPLEIELSLDGGQLALLATIVRQHRMKIIDKSPAGIMIDVIQEGLDRLVLQTLKIGSRASVVAASPSRAERPAVEDALGFPIPSEPRRQSADFETWLGFLNVAIDGENGHTWGADQIERLRAFQASAGGHAALVVTRHDLEEFVTKCLNNNSRYNLVWAAEYVKEWLARPVVALVPAETPAAPPNLAAEVEARLTALEDELRDAKAILDPKVAEMVGEEWYRRITEINAVREENAVLRAELDEEKQRAINWEKSAVPAMNQVKALRVDVEALRAERDALLRERDGMG